MIIRSGKSLFISWYFLRAAVEEFRCQLICTRGFSDKTVPFTDIVVSNPLMPVPLITAPAKKQVQLAVPKFIRELGRVSNFN